MGKMKFLAALIIAMICVGCGGSSSVDKAITQVEKALENVEKNKRNMTEADWQNLEKEMKEPLQIIANAIEENKIGMVERIKVVTLVAKWSATMMEAGLNQLEKETGINREDWGSELENVSKEIEKAFEGIDKGELEKVANELEKALEGLKELR